MKTTTAVDQAEYDYLKAIEAAKLAAEEAELEVRVQRAASAEMTDKGELIQDLHERKLITVTDGAKLEEYFNGELYETVVSTKRKQMRNGRVTIKFSL